MTRRVAVAAVGLLLVVLAGAVDANPVRHHRPKPIAQPVQTALRIADRYWATAVPELSETWQPPPCDGHVVVFFVTLPPGYAGVAPFGGCQIALSREFFPDGGAREWPLLCPTLIHERGHTDRFMEPGGATGGFHSADPRNVMFPVLNGQNTPAVCTSGLAAVKPLRHPLHW